MEDVNIYFIESQRRLVDMKTNPDYQGEISGTPATKQLFIRTEDDYNISLGWQQKLLVSSKPFTVAGVDIKSLAALNFSATAKAMSSYGVKISNSTLIGLKSLSYTKLYRKTTTALSADCENILALISQHAAGLADYKIDAPFTAKLVIIAKDLKDLTKLPLAVVTKHANDYDEYMLHEKKVRKFFDTEMDTFMQIYRLTDMGLYLAYLAARRSRHHHLKRKAKPIDPETTTGMLELLLLLKDSMAPAAGVNFVIVSLSISESSDEDGEIYIDGLAPGTYHGKLSMEGYKDIEFDLTIEAGKTCSMQFLMEAV
jgi:hypothetical protein